MKRTLLAALVAVICAWCPNALAQDTEECKTSKSDFWICSGDTAWVNGYLIPPTVFDLRQCDVWKKGYDLLPTVTQERDEYKQQRDKTTEALDAETARSTTLSTAYDGCTAALTQQIDTSSRCLSDLDDTFTVWDMVLVGVGTGVTAAALGVLIGALAI